MRAAAAFANPIPDKSPFVSGNGRNGHQARERGCAAH